MGINVVRTLLLRPEYKYCPSCGAIVDIYSSINCEYCRPNSFQAPIIITVDNYTRFYVEGNIILKEQTNDARTT